MFQSILIQRWQPTPRNKHFLVYLKTDTIFVKKKKKKGNLFEEDAEQRGWNDDEVVSMVASPQSLQFESQLLHAYPALELVFSLYFSSLPQNKNVRLICDWSKWVWACGGLFSVYLTLCPSLEICLGFTPPSRLMTAALDSSWKCGRWCNFTHNYRESSGEEKKSNHKDNME